jgi:hypothetical protein
MEMLDQHGGHDVTWKWTIQCRYVYAQRLISSAFYLEKNKRLDVKFEDAIYLPPTYVLYRF